MLVLLVMSGLIISICMGLRQSLGLFMRPMTLELGISAATFAFAIALQNIVWGLSQPFVGALADRYGPRPVLIGTALLYATGLLLRAPESVAMLGDDAQLAPRPTGELLAEAKAAVGRHDTAAAAARARRISAGVDLFQNAAELRSRRAPSLAAIRRGGRAPRGCCRDDECALLD